MLNIAPAHTQIDPFLAALRQGICALKLNKIQDSFRGLSAAFQINSLQWQRGISRLMS